MADVLGTPPKPSKAPLTLRDWEVAPGEVDALPGHANTIRFDARPEELEAQTGQPQIPGRIRLVLIDCPPSLGALTRSSRGPDLALVVTTPSYFGPRALSGRWPRSTKFERTTTATS